MGNMWHVKNWFRVGHRISWKLNFHTLCAFLCLYRPSRFLYKESLKKHEFVLSYLRKDLCDVINRYKSIDELTLPVSTSRRNTIWTIWWQGEGNAPSLVKACIKSMRDNANGAEVIVVDKDNCSSYVDIPGYIFEKQEKGEICMAVLSDIIRFHLLERYGGLWLDSTIYVARPIPSEYFALPFFSQHTKPQPMTCWVQNNAYHIFVVGSREHGKLVSFTKDMFLEYWKNHDIAVDYLCTDYFFMLAYQEFADVKAEIDGLPWSSERLYDLVRMLDKPFEENEFDRLKSECIFSKLDWHRKYRTTKKGRKTYYGTIVEDAFEYD